MPAYEESFAPEPQEAAPLAADPAIDPVADPASDANPVASDPATDPEPDSDPQADPSADPEPDADLAPDPATDPTPDPATDSVPVFVEADYLKSILGDAAPSTAAELKQRLDQLQAKQITPEQEAQLALLADPNKLAELAAQVGTKDFDKLDAVENMRERFARDNPGMSEAQRERRFQRQFAEKYPALAAALASPDDFDAEDPALIAEKEDADYDANADRAANKAAQEERTKQFVASHAPAATQPKLTAEQEADATALPKWLDEAYKDGATIPVDAGDNLKFNLPVPNAADFKAAFNNTFDLLDKFTLTKPLSEGGVINRENHALLTAFLQNPTAFVKNIATAARAAMPKPAPGIPIADLTNSSTSKRPAPKATPAAAAPVTGTNNQPEGINADSWHDTNI